MPYLRKDAPAHIPEGELIESLLGKKCDNFIKPLQKLTDEERKRTNIVQIGKRNADIDGDPYGVWASWSGNVYHPKDKRMFTVLVPILDKLIAAKPKEGDEVATLRRFLGRIPHSDLPLLAKEFGEDGTVNITSESNQTTIRFRLGTRTVRIIHASDLDVDDKKSFNQSARAKDSARRTKEILGEEIMPIEVQQYLMAKILTERRAEFKPLLEKQAARRKNIVNPKRDVFSELRSCARVAYWMDMSPSERTTVRETAMELGDSPELSAAMAQVQAGWRKVWNNGARDRDYFRNYLTDQTAAKEVWTLVEEDIFVVVDKNQRVVFANIEKLAQIMFGDEVLDLLDRAIDLWSFYNGLPLPESSRHVVDTYIRRIHPELDPSKATVETLPNAKMAVAHYGCWARKGDPHGRNIALTVDTMVVRNWVSPDMCLSILHQFAQGVFGSASKIMRFLVKELDESYYRECVEIFENLPPESRLLVDAEEDWISLFALGINGYTQRHSDIGDIQGGLAGLFTLGRYTGASLCIPQLGIKVPYSPGSCAVIRGNALEHLVQDYNGPRFFVIGTNHESCKRNAWRKLGKLPPLPPIASRVSKRKLSISDKSSENTETGDSENFDEAGLAALEGPCMNGGCDNDDDSDIEWTNEILHGPAVLPPSAFYQPSPGEPELESSESASSSGSSSG